MNYEPMLSVRLMTYNHEKYIEEALMGIMKQETNFNFEVIVGDDFSTDQTPELIRKFKDTDRISIKVLKRPVGDDYDIQRKKHGRFYNFIDILRHCKGKYIALLDGDDYWTDPMKLQKQVDFLEQNPDYTLCFTDRMNYIDDTGEMEDAKTIRQHDFSFRDYLVKADKGIITATATSLFRADQLRRFDLDTFLNYCKKSLAADTMLFSCILTGGKGKILKDKTTVYRVTNVGVSSGFTNRLLYTVRITTYKFLLDMKLITNKEDENFVKKRLRYMRQSRIKNAIFSYTNKLGLNHWVKRILKGI